MACLLLHALETPETQKPYPNAGGYNHVFLYHPCACEVNLLLVFGYVSIKYNGNCLEAQDMNNGVAFVI